MSTAPPKQTAAAASDARSRHFLLSGEGWPYLLVPLIPVVWARSTAQVVETGRPSHRAAQRRRCV